MTREELLEKICPADTESECGCVECNFCCEDCNNMLECMILEYEKQIRADVIDEITQRVVSEEKWLFNCYLENGCEYSCKDIDIAFGGIKHYLLELKRE